MWLWLQNEHFKRSSMFFIKKYILLTERQKFLMQLCVVTLLGHVFVLLMATWLSSLLHAHQRFVISAQNRNTVYVLAPLQKQVKLSRKQSLAKSIKSSKVIDYGTYERLKKQQKKQSTKKSVMAVSPIKKRKTSKALASSLVALKQDKGSQRSKTQLTISQVEIIKEPQPQSQVVLEEIKLISSTQEQNAPITPPTQERKIADLSKDESALKTEEDLLVQEESAEQKILSDRESWSVDEDVDIDHVTFIGYEQLDTLAVQNKIQQLIQHNFKFPIGLKKDVSCEVTVLIGDKGKSKDVTMIRSSGIVVYDTAARAMLYKIEFPQEVWNKTITIVLGQ